MGVFHVSCRIENHVDRTKSVRLPKILVDTGSEHTWLPAAKLERIGVAGEKKDVAFVMANGQVVTRTVGFAVLHVDKYFTIDEVVFAEKGDLSLLGARTLEGLNLAVDAGKRRLVAARPIPAARILPRSAENSLERMRDAERFRFVRSGRRSLS